MLCIVECLIREVGKDSVLFGGWGGFWAGGVASVSSFLLLLFPPCLADLEFSFRNLSHRITSGSPSLAPSWPQRASPLHFRSSVSPSPVTTSLFPLPTSVQLTSLLPSSTSSVNHHALYTSLLQTTPTLLQLHFLFNHPRRLPISLSQSLAAWTSRILQPVQLVSSLSPSTSVSSTIAMLTRLPSFSPLETTSSNPTSPRTQPPPPRFFASSSPFVSTAEERKRAARQRPLVPGGPQVSRGRGKVGRGRK